MAEWIVDGNNVMGSRPDGWWRDRRGAQRRLVERLETFAEARDEPVTVIFDGRAHDAGGGSRVAVRDRVRAAGGEVVGAGAFLRQLDDAE